MTEADVKWARSIGVALEADERQPRPALVAHVAAANYDRMREQMQAANRSLAVDLDYQTQRAASLVADVKRQAVTISRLWAALAVASVVVSGLAAWKVLGQVSR